MGAFKSVLIFLLITIMVSAVNALPPTLIWSDPTPTNEAALSEDGQYVAIASGSQVRFYSRGSGTPIWTYSLPSGTAYSVAISADGDCVALGSSTSGQSVSFFKNAKSLLGTPTPDWTNGDLKNIFRRCLAISSDGNYLVACGTLSTDSDLLVKALYWGNTKADGRDGSTTWTSYVFGESAFESIDISSDGDYVVVGGYNFGGMILYWKGAKSLSGDNKNSDWSWKLYGAGDIRDVVVSADGDYVVGVGSSRISYFAGAKSRSSFGQLSTWDYGYSGTPIYFRAVGMSSDGDSVIAGGDDKVYFWSGAKGLTGKPQDPTWSYTAESDVQDVAINPAGDYMAAANDVSAHYVYFLDPIGNLRWPPYSVDGQVNTVSISSDGGTLAVATYGGGTGYLFDTFRDPSLQYRPPHYAVGGRFIQVNKLTILTPYLALVGLISILSTLYILKKQKT